MQGRDYGAMKPWSFSEEALEGARGGASNSFGDVFGVAAVSTLDQQATQILFATQAGFTAAKERSEVSVKGGERVRYSRLAHDLTTVAEKEEQSSHFEHSTA